MNAAQATEFATKLLAAVNSHDIDRLVILHADDAQVQSPAVIKLMNEPSGIIRGHAAIREYYTRAWQTWPYLQLTLIEALGGLTSVVAWFVNQRGTRSSAFLDLGPDNRITRNVTHYSD